MGENMLQASVIIVIILMLLMVRNIIVLNYQLRANHCWQTYAQHYLHELKQYTDLPENTYYSLLHKTDEFVNIYNKQTTQYTNIFTIHQWTYNSIFGKYEKEIQSYSDKCLDELYEISRSIH